MSQNENVLWRFWTQFGMCFWKLLHWSKLEPEMNSRKCCGHSKVSFVFHCWSRILYLLAVSKDGLSSFPMCLKHSVVQALPEGASAKFEVWLSFSLFVLLTSCRRYLNSWCRKCNCKVPDINCKEGGKAETLRRECEESFFFFFVCCEMGWKCVFKTLWL